MGRNVLTAKLDVIFKKFFTENKDMLHAFIADILEIPMESITEIVITNPELVPETSDGKFSRVDLNLKVDGSLINIEVQLDNDEDFIDRTLFYWSKLYTSELKKGEPYSTLKKTITINIVDFKMFDGTDFHNEIITSIKGTGEVFSDKFSMHFLELKKVGKNINPNNRRELWMHFFNADSEEDFEMLKKTNDSVMGKAVDVIYDMSEDTKIREMARLREKTLHDNASAMANAIKKGHKQMIEAMRESGMSDDQINEVIKKLK